MNSARLRQRLKELFSLVVLIVIFGALSLWIGRIDPTIPNRVNIAGWAFASSFFGASVGFAELLSRYRDEPIQAAATGPGLMYLAFNAFISLAAFAVLRQYAESIFPVVKENLFLTATIAGFGAMAIFRSKFFVFRSEDGDEYEIGPSIVLDTILKTIDRKIDRSRSIQRQTRVFEKMKSLSDFPRTAQYFQASILSFQNLSSTDKAALSEVIEQYKTVEWPDPLKITALGYTFLTIAGEENFDQVVKNLQDYLETLKVKVNPVSAGTAANSPPVGP